MATFERQGREVVQRRGVAPMVRAFVSSVLDPSEYGRMPKVSDLDFTLRPGDIVAIDSRGRKRLARVTKVGPVRVQTEYTTESAIQTADRYGGELAVTRKPVALDDAFLRFAERPTKEAAA